MSNIKIGTRGSPLAVAQTEIFRTHLQVPSELIKVVTSGDKKQNSGEGILRDKKDWIVELEENLLNKNIDLAIHSAKDVPIDIADNTSLVPVLKRESPYDVLISKKDISGQLSSESLNIGTSSLRRTAQLKLYNQKLNINKLRGNINTRLAKLDDEFDGIVLAEAGVKRLGIENYKLHQLLQFIPASNQGILVAQYRSDDIKTKKILEQLIDYNTKIAFEVERTVVELLGADCHSALGVYCKIENNMATTISDVFSNYDFKFINCQISSDIDQYHLLAKKVADELISKGALNYL